MRKVINEGLIKLRNLESAKILRYLVYIFVVSFYIMEYFKISNPLYIMIGLTVLDIFYIVVYRKKLKSDFELYRKNRLKINNLEFYYMKDSEKSFDKVERIKNNEILNNIIGSLALLLSLILLLFALIFMKNSALEHIVIIILEIVLIPIFIIFVFYRALSYIYKFPTMTYTLIPFFSLVIYYFFFSLLTNKFLYIKILLDLLPLIQLALYLLTTFICYIAFANLPIYIIRKVRSNTIFISAIVTIIVSFIPQVASQFISYFMSSHDLEITAKTVAEWKIKPGVKEIISNPSVLETMNHVVRQEMLDQISNFTFYICTGLTLSVLIGGLILYSKVSRKERLAQANFRHGLFNENLDYKDIKSNSYLGGDVIDNLVINNKELLKIVLNEETGIPDDNDSIKRIIKEYERKMKKHTSLLL